MASGKLIVVEGACDGIGKLHNFNYWESILKQMEKV